MTTNTTKNNYFDLHTTGIGYLNRIREVKPKKGNTYLACSIAALSGECASPNYTYIECNIVGEEARRLISRCKDASAKKSRILISFVIGDIVPETFVYAKGEKSGQTGVQLRGRLLLIKSITINGEAVYKRSSLNNDDINDNRSDDNHSNDNHSNDDHDIDDILLN